LVKVTVVPVVGLVVAAGKVTLSEPVEATYTLLTPNYYNLQVRSVVADVTAQAAVLRTKTEKSTEALSTPQVRVTF